MDCYVVELWCHSCFETCIMIIQLLITWYAIFLLQISYYSGECRILSLKGSVPVFGSYQAAAEEPSYLTGEFDQWDNCFLLHITWCGALLDGIC